MIDTMTMTAALAGAVQAACPGADVYVGDPADRATWGVVYPEGATEAQRQAATAVIAGWSAPVPIATVTGNQWAFALDDMALASAWQLAVAKSKSSDQVRIGLIARDTPLAANDPLLIRVAGNAGNDSGGAPLIAVAVVHAHAVTMPT